MELASLRAFLAIAERGSFSRAGETLHLSQPAISKRIRALESSLGVRLFDRIGRQIRLTDAGRALLPHAQRVVQDSEDGRRALTHLADRPVGRLSLGTSHHVGLYRLPPVLKSFTAEFPQVDLDLHFADSEIACQAVLDGSLELAVVTLPPTPVARLRESAIWHDELVVVVPPDHPLAQQPSPNPRVLAAQPAVLPDAATYTHRIILDALARHRVRPHLRLASNYLETLKMLVATGLGWSVLPRSMLDDSIVELKLPGLAMSRRLGAVWHAGRTLSKAAVTMLARLERERDPVLDRSSAP